MSFVPILTDSLSSIKESKFLFTYGNMFIDISDPGIEGSHIHGFYEIYVNVSGDVSFLHNKNIYRINPGDVIISKPGEFHHCIYHSSCIHKHYCIWFDAESSSDVSYFIEKHNISGLVRLEDNVCKNMFDILNILKKTTDRFEKTVLFLDLIKLLKEKNTPSSDEVPHIPFKMQKILEYINDNFTEIRFIDEIAEKFHISVPTVNRWFREYANLSPNELLKAKKLSYAEKLLRDDYSVTDACFSAGFADLSRFISLFKRHYGKTPLQYKKQHQ